MAAMSPEKAREVTAELAQMRMTSNAAAGRRENARRWATPGAAQPPLAQSPPSDAAPAPAKAKGAVTGGCDHDQTHSGG